MQTFLNKDFLLTNKTAQKLYHEAAAGEPVFDYHCHLRPKEIAENRRFTDLAQVWLGEKNGAAYGDHYKWRVMRANGVDEALITGSADPYEKFLAWADTVPALVGNPLYHWTHLELQRYFGIYEPLNGDSAPAIWKAANEKIKNDPGFSVYGIFKKFNVYAVGTTDDPADNLEWHEKIAASNGTATKVLPSFRPDKALNIDKEGFAEYIAELGQAAGRNIGSLSDLLDALKDRIEYFDRLGCRASDHGLEYLPYEAASDGSTGGHWEKEVSETFAKGLANNKTGECLYPDKRAVDSYKTYILSFLASCYAEKNWAMQLHIGVIRSNNTKMLRAVGPDTGFDAVHDHHVAANLSRFLDLLEQRDSLPKTILYSLNFGDFYPMATIMGCFQGGIPGKMQLGSSWWFLDHRDGMEEMMKLLANTGLLSRFIGMLTDSRSFLSYPRHEYFRRILCNLLGTWAESGEVPNDFSLLSDIVRDISFRNAQRYFYS
uniref:Uronate isomerase n=1 Tax=uncultured bacterium contig00037 TaxID=1181525 RepID=A0A806KFD0_9BACT|nr:uronate isomerase [uncultured bacterium contig00037]